MRYYATGRVLPERASVGFSRIQFAIDSGTVAIACDASQIAVTLDSLSSVDGWITARVQAELYARVIVSNLGFHKGCGYSVEIVQVTEENGVAHVFGVGVVGLAFAEGSRAFHRAFELSNRDLYFRLAVQDYVRALTEISDCATYCYRAIESISKQSWRLSRLVDHLFLAMRMREGAVRFEPKPFDFSALVVRSVLEIKSFLAGRVFTCELQESVTVLGDEPLLEHGIWSLLTCASAMSHSEKPLKVILVSTHTQARLLVQVPDANLSFHDIESLFVPFGSVQYEDRSGIRTAVGLYLCKQIVQLHNGRLGVSDKGIAGVQFCMGLPR